MSLYSPRIAAPTSPSAKTPGLFATSPLGSSGNLSRMEVSVSALHSPDTHVPPEEEDTREWQHLYVLPVLWLEFLAIALTRAVLPSLLLERYEKNVYIVMGFTEFVRGILAFVSCPLFGKLSDVVGRRICLFVTVAGTCAPVCALALLPWETQEPSSEAETMVNATSASVVPSEADESETGWPFMFVSPAVQKLEPRAISIFVLLLALSGIFSSTFTLVFAYISDTVRHRDKRVSAYGLALATFGLSFTIGPMAGGYLAQYNARYVFVCSFILTILDLIYIYAILPESLPVQEQSRGSGASIGSVLPQNISWSPLETLRIIAVDPFLRRVGQVAFLYYTALWAVISTLMLYATSRFHLGPERLGELMSLLGLSTMISEAVLVRIFVPMLGEKKAMRLGLAAFGMQCVVLGVAYEPWHLFVCILFSMLGNLVYPSLSSLVSGSVAPDAVGEALGAVNGIKALTEGFGPLLFGTLMTLSEKSPLPGWPYLLAALIVHVAYRYSRHLPDVQQDEYIHELERKRRGSTELSLAPFLRPVPDRLDVEDEYQGLLGSESHEDEEDNRELVHELSEIDESEEEGGAESPSEDMSRLPLTFGSLSKQ